MKVKTISVVYERKLNLGDYCSATIGATAWADLDEGEDEKAAYVALFAEVKGVVKEQATPLFARHKAEVERVFAGLPVELREEIVKAEAQRVANGEPKAA